MASSTHALPNTWHELVAACARCHCAGRAFSFNPATLELLQHQASLEKLAERAGVDLAAFSSSVGGPNVAARQSRPASMTLPPQIGKASAPGIGRTSAGP